MAGLSYFEGIEMKFPLIALFFTLSSSFASDSKLEWQGWSDTVFERAKTEKKLVLLDLEAVWCHWCHVMEEKTYSNPEVAKILKKHYLLIRVDQESRPDLSQRYEDYGWPATILFDGEGKELAMRSGFIEPRAMASILQAFVDDPRPGPSVVQEDLSGNGMGIEDSLRKDLTSLQEERYDKKKGGWGVIHKYVDPDDIEYSIRLARKKNEKAKEEARATLKLNYKIQDPAWGGVYQYSVQGWDEPHFEKVLSYQTGNIIAYSLAYQQWGDPKYLKTAESIYGYLTNFLQDPNGAFYTSQDADLIQGQHSEKYFRLGDKARREKGIPRVDKHQYARENGWVIEAMCRLYTASGDLKYLDTAKKAADWVLQNRPLANGGFRHDERDLAGPYLGDTLAMGRAFLALYRVTADRSWLTFSAKAFQYIEENFRIKRGYATSKSASKFMPLRASSDENVQLARFSNLLYQYTGEEKAKGAAEHALRFITIPSVRKRLTPSALLILDEEFRQDPTHLTIVGGKADSSAKDLFLAAIRFPDNYLRVEWWDKAEGNLPRNDVSYPMLSKAAAFLCSEKKCSLPIYEGAMLAKRIKD